MKLWEAVGTIKLENIPKIYESQNAKQENLFRFFALLNDLFCKHHSVKYAPTLINTIKVKVGN